MRTRRRFYLWVMISSIGTVLLLLLPEALGTEVHAMDLGLTPPGATNTISMTISGTVLVLSDSDSKSGTLTGNILASLGMTFNPDTLAVESVDTLELTGGHIAISDMSFSLSWIFAGGLEVTSVGIGGTCDTPNPPGLVTDGNFNAADHQVILNEGSFNADGSGKIVDYMPADPYVVDLAQNPAAATTQATGTIVVSLPTIGGDQSTYTVTLTLPVSLDEVVFEVPGTAKMEVKGTGTIEARGQFSRPLSSFGAVAPPAFTAIEEAAAGATSFARGAGQKELGWTMSAPRVTTYAAVAGSFTDPDDPTNHRQFHVNNADVTITSEKIDVRGLQDVQVAIDLRVWDQTTGFEANDRIALSILASQDGVSFGQEIPWLELTGTAASALDTEQNGRFTPYLTPAGLIPDTVRSIQLVIALRNDSNNEHIFWDNVRVVTTPPFRRGDCNADGAVDISDSIRTITWLFQKSVEPACLNACDSNDDGAVDLSDPLFGLVWLFLNGSAPAAPGPSACGQDRTLSPLPSCLTYAKCP